MKLKDIIREGKHFHKNITKRRGDSLYDLHYKDGSQSGWSLKKDGRKWIILDFDDENSGEFATKKQALNSMTLDFLYD